MGLLKFYLQVCHGSGSGISSRLSCICRSFLVVAYHFLKYPAVLNLKLLYSFWGWQGEDSKAFEIVENKWHVARVITMDVEAAG